MNAPIEIRELAAARLVELDHLPALLAIRLLLLQLLGESCDARGCRSPQCTQLEVDERVHGDLGIAQILLEHLHVLLRARRGSFLIADLLEQLDDARPAAASAPS